ncbi:unnamed protein product, partial [marine sediment metagenome]
DFISRMFTYDNDGRSIAREGGREEKGRVDVCKGQGVERWGVGEGLGEGGQGEGG